MIVTNEIEIMVVGRTVRYYTELGYSCKAKQKLTIDVNHLPKTSHVIIECSCDYCKNPIIEKMAYYVYIKSINTNGKKSCNVCKQIKVEETNLIKYGVKRPLQNVIIQDKCTNTMIKKYGYSRSGSTDIAKKHLSDLFKQRYIDEIKNLNIGTFKHITNDGYAIECNICHNEFILNLSIMSNRIAKKHSPCPICLPPYSSNFEVEIIQYIDSIIDTEIIKNTRQIIKPLELDIYLPKYNIAIECNGIYWHSEIYKSKDYHINKTKECLKQNIRLIHIWEDDWCNKKDIVKNMLSYIFKCNTTKINARSCIIKQIDNKIAEPFFDTYHLQGHRRSKYYYALFDKSNNIVACASFNDKVSKFIKGTDNIPELVRYCTNNTNVRGGLSKLIKHFLTVTNNTKIISYADRSWSVGSGYINSGFKIINYSLPGYSYVINNIMNRFHRFNFRKDILIKEGYDSTLTEREIMSSRGYSRIFDCGQIKLIYDSSSC